MHVLYIYIYTYVKPGLLHEGDGHVKHEPQSTKTLCNISGQQRSICALVELLIFTAPTGVGSRIICFSSDWKLKRMYVCTHLLYSYIYTPIYIYICMHIHSHDDRSDNSHSNTHNATQAYSVGSLTAVRHKYVQYIYIYIHVYTLTHTKVSRHIDKFR